jgi:signal transduction histidine kinase/ligand-binding sensor domain-containing protein
VDQGLPHRTVTDFLETRYGEFWLATYGGLVRFNPKGKPVGHVVYANAAATEPPMFTVVVPENEDRYARAATVLLESRDGTIWCGTMKHLYRLHRQGERFELLPVDIGILAGPAKQVHVLDLLEDRRGSLWVASFSGLVRRRPDGSTEQYTKRDGLPDNNIHDLLEDHQGQLWAGTRLDGFFRFAADDSHAPPVVAEAYSRPNGLPTDWVFQLYETSDRRFWVATNLGLVEFFPDGDGQGRRFRTYTRRNGLSFQEITALNEDTGGNLWLGTPAAGAMKLARNGFVTYGEQDGLVTVNAIFEDAAGGVCFRGVVLGDQRGNAFDGATLDLLHAGADQFFQRFGRFDGQRFDWFKPDIPFDFGWVPEQVAVQTREGEWWVGSGAGLYRFPASDSFARIKTARPLAVYTTNDGLPSPQVSRVFADSGGNVWVSAFGLARWDRASQTLSNLADAPGLPSPKDNAARSLCEDRAGNVWISFNPGVARYRNGRFTFFTASDGLPPGAIMDIYSDRAGRLWLTSARGGLIRVEDPAAERPAFTSYTTAQGLSSNSTEVITEDLYGRIYVATGRGLDRLNPETGRIKHFTTADGLAAGNVIAAFRDRRGTLWFGTHRGMSRFVPAPEENSPPPPILITGLNIAGEQRKVSALGETEIALFNLAPDQNQLQVDFVALGFALGEGLRYQYKLEGASEDWSPLSEQRTVNFNLAPGRYDFLVRAVNADGILSERPASFAFTILPPIWQRWWFIAIGMALAGLFAYALYRYRVARLLELERVRTRIASDLHDDIGANLTRIAILSEVAHRQLREGKASIESPLSSIAQISRESVASMGDIVWAINPKRDHLIDLIQRMRRLASEVLAGRKIEFEFRAPESEDGLKLGADVRRDVFLIFKEAVSNAARHSGCSSVDIELRVERSSIVLTVRDDGRGFDTAAPTEGNGLVSMQRRATGLGGELELESIEGKGTKIMLTVAFR